MLAVLKRNNLDQEAAASMLGITQPGLNHFLTGKRAPKAEFIQKFCDTFQVSPNYLFGGEDNIAVHHEDIDRSVIQTIITKITEWEQQNNYEYNYEAKAELIKLLYDRVINLTQDKQETEVAKIIDIYQYIKGAS